MGTARQLPADGTTLLSQAFENSFRAAAIVAPDTEQVLFSNLAWQELVLPADDAGQTLHEALERVFPGAWTHTCQVLRNGQPLCLRAIPMCSARDGSASWWDLEFIPIARAAEDDPAVLITARDVTDHVLSKRDVEDAQAALTATDDKLRLAQDATGLGIWEWNIEADQLAWSPVQFRLHGMDPTTGVPPTFGQWLNMIHPDDRARMLAAADQLPAGAEQGLTVEFRLRRADTGEERWLLSRKRVVARSPDGRPARMIGVTLDITDRRQEQAALYESEARLRLAFEAGGMFAWDWDLQAGRVTWAHDLARSLGQPADLSGGSMDDVLELVYPDDLPGVKEALRQAVAGEVPLYQAMFRVRRPDGGVRWTASSGIVIRDVSGRSLRVVGVDHDITEHRAAEIALRERESQQATIARLGHFALEAPSAQAVMNETVKTVAATLEVEYCKILELLPDESAFLLQAGVGWREAYPVGRAMVSAGRASQAGYTLSHDSGPVIVADLAQETRFSSTPLLTDHGVVSGLSVIIRGSGAGGSNFGVLGAHTARRRDFTEHDIRFLEAAAHIVTTAVLRERTDVALRLGQQRFLQFGQAVDDVLWIFARDDGQTLYISPAFARVFGTVLPAVPGELKAWTEALHPEDRDRVLATLATNRRTGFFDLEYRIIRPDGEMRWIHDRAWPIQMAEGEPDQAARIASDVTAFVRARELAADWSAELERRVAGRTEALAEAAQKLAAEMRRREETQAALVQSQKLEALGQLTGGVAHDLNNVLTAIGGSYALIRRRTDLKPVLDLVQRGEQAAERARRLVAQLLAFAHKQELSPQILDLSSVLHGAADLVHHAIGPDISCQFEIAQSLWSVLADPHQLEIAVLNLAVNARDAMSRGGRLVIGARNLQPAERPAELAQNDYVAVFVRDTGEGMPPDVVARATEPFFTTKPVGQGTGLGLAMVHGFARQSGGCIRIASRQGEGTTVEIVLPRGALEASADAGEGEMPIPIDPSLHGNAVVLLVEDDDQIRPLAASFLRGLGYTVIEAPNAEVAKVLAFSLGRLDLLITDITMPGEDGPVLANRLRVERPDLAVLFVTARDPGPALETERVLRKPFTYPSLADAVLQRLGRDASTRSDTPDRLLARLRNPALRRLYVDWRGKHYAGGRLPGFGSVEPDAFGLGPHAYQVEIRGSGPPIFHFLKVGRALLDRLGRDPQFDLGKPGSGEENLLGTLEGAFRRCVDKRAPFYEMARYDLGDGPPVQFERLILPLSNDGEQISHLLGVALFE